MIDGGIIQNNSSQGGDIIVVSYESTIIIFAKLL